VASHYRKQDSLRDLNSTNGNSKRRRLSNYCKRQVRDSLNRPIKSLIFKSATPDPKGKKEDNRQIAEYYNQYFIGLQVEGIYIATLGGSFTSDSLCSQIDAACFVMVVQSHRNQRFHEVLFDKSFIFIISLTIAINRGNAESLICLFVVAILYCILSRRLSLAAVLFVFEM